MNKPIGFSILTLCILLLILAAMPEPVSAIECVANENIWTGSVNITWSEVGNWSQGTLPCIETSVIIPASAAPNFPVASEFIGVSNLTVDQGASFDLNGQTLLVDVALVNNGTLIDQRAITDADLPFGTCFFCTGGYAGLILSRDSAGVNDPGVVKVLIRGNQATCDSGDSTIGRCFDIQPSNKDNISIDAIFVFDPAELKGLSCGDLQAYHWTGDGWTAAGAHFDNDCEELPDPQYSIWTVNITSFSPFVGSSGEPVAVSMISFNAMDAGQKGSLIITLIVLVGVVATAGILIKRHRSVLN